MRDASRTLLLWAALLSPGLAFAAVASHGPLSSVRWVDPTAAFAVIVALTALCLIGALIVLVVGRRAGLAEITILGAALAVQSFLSLVHGLTVPGVLLGDNDAVVLAAFISVPAALVVGLPLLAPAATPLRLVARHWWSWCVAALSAVAIAGLALLLRPDAVPAPTPGSPFVILVAAASLAGVLVLSLRHLRLYRLGRRRASLCASVGFLYLGLSTLVWLGAAPFSLGWWGAHAADGLGVLAAALGLVLAHRRDGSIAATLAPVVNRDPLVALELGLTPVVHRFIAALEDKDLVTRDHVVRVGELAMRVGVRADLAPERIHALGLGALLHDVGKLNAPTRILQKAGPLTDEEFDLMKSHTLWGTEMMMSSPLLAGAARFVRWHHERADGTGYPDGLDDDRIPLEAAIISVCDAWDAMTFTRPYRPGMEHQRALGILIEGAGSQWRPDAVGLLARELEENGPIETPLYDGIGRDRSLARGAGEESLPAICPDALPAGVPDRKAAGHPSGDAAALK